MPTTNLDRANTIQEVGQLFMQGAKETEIARQLNISPHTVKNYLNEWEEYIKDKAQSDPDFLDRVLENTLKFMENYDYILQEAWSMYNEAKEAGVVTSRIQALKLVNDLTSQKARLVNLLGPKVDSRSFNKARKAERVNEILSVAIKNVISECERCRPKLWAQLETIFNSNIQEAAELESGDEPNDHSVIEG